MLNWCVFVLYVCAATCFSLIIYVYSFSTCFSDWACVEYDAVNKQYDYVIVGGGTAGAIVATLLSRSGDSVLVIEAGIDASTSLLNIPVVAPLLQQTQLDWQYQTEHHDNACLALHNHVSRWPMGRLLGGTSKLNSLVYLRGDARDYDAWAQVGNTGWSYEDVLPYFKASEKFEGSSKSYYHGDAGLAAVSPLQWTTSLVQAFLAAGEMLGYTLQDLNGARHTGFMEAQVNLLKGARWSTDQCLSKQVGSGANLRVLTSSSVLKVLLRNGFEAYAVQYLRSGSVRTVRAHKAVVLSAGVVGSPKILMLSGIGPAQHLQQLGIPVVQDLPVGRNLQDHVTTGLDLVLLNQSLPLSLAAVQSPYSFLQYVWHGQGPWTFPGCEGVAVVHTKLSNDTTDPPDLQMMLLPTGISSDGGVRLRRAVGVSDQVWTDYFAPLYGRPAVSVLPILLHPKSRGEVLLRSSDPQDLPIIRANYLTHPHDVHTLMEGLQLVKQLVATQPMQQLGARLYDKPLPGCSGFQFDSAAYWECYIRHLTLTSFHPAGTCKMGTTSDPSSVVDPFLRVHNTNKLYVIDASVMPTLPSANINAAVMMIAHKGADLVQAQWKLVHGKSKRRPWFISQQQRHNSNTCYL